MRKLYQTKKSYSENLQYFSNILSNLDIQRPPNITLHHDPVLNVIKKLENHPSILEIKKKNKFRPM